MARAVHPEVEVTHEAEVDHEAAPGADRAVDHEAVADLNRDHEAEVGEENHEPDQSREVHERIRVPPVVHVAAVDHADQSHDQSLDRVSDIAILAADTKVKHIFCYPKTLSKSIL